MYLWQLLAQPADDKEAVCVLLKPQIRFCGADCSYIIVLMTLQLLKRLDNEWDDLVFMCLLISSVLPVIALINILLFVHDSHNTTISLQYILKSLNYLWTELNMFNATLLLTFCVIVVTVSIYINQYQVNISPELLENREDLSTACTVLS